MSNISTAERLVIRRTNVLRGPNIWANFPVIEAVVDLKDLKETSSEMISGFNERLMTWLPGMIEHRCSVGERGGFFQRLRRGTYMAHILEHVVLELQTLGGNSVGFGRARELDEDGVYRVVFAYHDESVGKEALEAARRVVLAAVDNTPIDIEAEISRLRDLVHANCLGPSTQGIVQAAKQRGIPYMRLNDGNLVQLGYGSRQRRIWTAESDRTSAIAEAIAKDKELTRNLLHSAGIPVPEGGVVESKQHAWEKALEIGLPVVVKPQCGNHGRGVSTNLYTQQEVEHAYELAYLEESTILVEKFFEGADHRMLVIGNQLVAAARREPAKVIGDGQHTIRQLIDLVNQDPRRSDGHATVMSYITLDEVALAVLTQQGFAPDDVPELNQIVYIRRNANLSSGGTACDVTKQVHPQVAARVVEAAQVVGLDIAGVDVVARDISVPLEDQNGGIVEVNAGPGLRMHIQPSEGDGQPVCEAIVNMLFPAGDNGRIPIVAVTGVNGKTTTARLIGHIVHLSGKRVGLTSTDGVYFNGRRIDDGDCSGPKSAKRVLMNPSIDAAVLETARGGILREGLAFDKCDVAVVTNIGEGDHLGLNNINTLEHLAKVKRCIVDVVAPNGCAVLNAEDPLVAAMAANCKGSVLYFAHSPDHPLLVANRQHNQRVVFTRDGSIMAAHGTSEFAVLPLDRIPITHGGKIRFQIENAMAAVAAAWVQGIPVEVIRAGLESFSSSINGSPGRFNIFQYNQCTLVIDYGHNTSALKSLLSALANFPNSRRSAVYSAAGDRLDTDMIRQGQMLGHHFDRVVLYEGSYCRGRKPGDIVHLFREGLALGSRVRNTQWFSTWRESVQHALDSALPDELIMIQADAVDETVEFFSKLALIDTGIPSSTLKAQITVDKMDGAQG
ncbi:MAG: cyanophycin synthetase [Pirellulaceae bacterium]|nr:cyanophycin synthetase [Pirellulaceae bacterium]